MSNSKTRLRLRKTGLSVLNPDQLGLVAGGQQHAVQGLTQRECGITRDTCDDYTDASCACATLYCPPSGGTTNTPTLRKDECGWG